MAEVRFKLPDLGEGLEDGEIVRWLVSEGDTISLNQPLVEVDTAKALVEIPSPFAGTVTKLHATEGETVKVGADLVTFEVQESAGKRRAVLVGYGVEEEAAPSRRRRLSGRKGPGVDRSRTGTDAAPAAHAPTAPVKTPATDLTPPPAPQVRKLASELGVDIDHVDGSGPGGRVTREDVLAASGKTGAQPGEVQDEERIAVKGVRKIVAAKMAESVRAIPHVTTYLTADASHLIELRTEIEQRTGTRVTPLALISKALVEICRVHPKLNSSWDEDSGEIVIKRYCHLGIATDTERGLLVPVVRDAHTKDVTDLAREIAEKAEAARAARSKPEELSGSTITVSNVGSFGAEFGTPIINLPEAAILAVGVIEDRVIAVNGAITVRPCTTLSLSFDHRIMDGAEAGRALMDLKKLIEDPQWLRT